MASTLGKAWLMQPRPSLTTRITGKASSRARSALS
jgi:hypothetical protein